MHQRRTTDGRLIIAPGSTIPIGDPDVFFAAPVGDIGRPVRGKSWPDENVISLAVIHFTNCDRVGLLTEDLKMRRWIQPAIAPLIAQYGMGRLGFHVFARRKATTTIIDFCQHIRDVLTGPGIAPGFVWDEDVTTEFQESD
jgi:hypothetical protein